MNLIFRFSSFRIPHSAFIVLKIRVYLCLSVDKFLIFHPLKFPARARLARRSNGL